MAGRRTDGPVVKDKSHSPQKREGFSDRSGVRVVDGGAKGGFDRANRTVVGTEIRIGSHRERAGGNGGAAGSSMWQTSSGAYGNFK